MSVTEKGVVCLGLRDIAELQCDIESVLTRLAQPVRDQGC